MIILLAWICVTAMLLLGVDDAKPTP